jgi:hypothetical protein
MISLRNKIKNSFNLGKAFSLSPRSTPCLYFSSKAKPSQEIKATSPMKLVFDQDNKATIFKHTNGEVICFSREIEYIEPT